MKNFPNLSLVSIIKEYYEENRKFIECRCNYSQRVNFDMKFIEGNLYNCNYREKEYKKNENLFLSKVEFDSFYNKGDDVIQKEVGTRILKKEEETAVNEIISNAQNKEFGF